MFACVQPTCIHVYMHVYDAGGGMKLTSGILLHLSGSLVELRVCQFQLILLIILLRDTQSLTHAIPVQLLDGFWDSNSSPHTWAASAASTEPSPQPQSF